MPSVPLIPEIPGSSCTMTVWLYDCYIVHCQIPQTSLYVKLNSLNLVLKLVHFLCKLWSCVTSYLARNSDLYLQYGVLMWKTWLQLLFFGSSILYRFYSKLPLSKEYRAVMNIIVMLHKAHRSISSEDSWACSHPMIPLESWVEVRVVLN